MLFFLFESVKGVLRFLLSTLVFPQTCLLCGKSTHAKPLCQNCCENTLFHTDFCVSEKNRCKKCGKELITEIDYCTTCRAQSVLTSVESVLPLYPYRFWAKKLLFVWKMQNDRSLSPLFAERLYMAWKTYFFGIPLIPIPPRPGKIRQKGWDQVAELCSFLRFRYAVPVIPLLQRTAKIQQKKLSRSNRLENNRSFILKKNIKCGTIPQTAVLLDDIMTTGATLQKCAAELQSAGVKTVYALTLFIVE